MRDSTKHLVVGFGEVGKGLQAVIGGAIHDPGKKKFFDGMCDFMHITIPYSNKFEDIVKDYKKKFKPLVTVIHSTVPVGTSDRLDACHSPIRGVHPNMVSGIKTFVKYVAGSKAEMVESEFKKKNMQVVRLKSARDSEAGKLWSTTQYGLFIMMNKVVKKWCEENDVNFDVVYKGFNETYNEGYEKLGMGYVRRPVLHYMEGKIGGHCVMPNAEILDDPLAEYLTEYNKML